jgi:hypothetical protein
VLRSWVGGGAAPPLSVSVEAVGKVDLAQNDMR